jgi:hypothetical protein
MTIAAIFRREKTLESFRAAVAALDGDFPFAAPNMIALGEAYFEAHPDRVHDRSAEEVQLGYGLVRVCVIEKAVRELDPGRREAYRTIFNDVARAGPVIESLLASAGRAAVSLDYDALSAALNAIRATIDEIPKGMIKERFVGGISNLFNILYILKMKLAPAR